MYNSLLPDFLPLSTILHFVVIQKQSQTAPSSEPVVFLLSFLVSRLFSIPAIPFSMELLTQRDVLLMKMKKHPIFSLILSFLPFLSLLPLLFAIPLHLRSSIVPCCLPIRIWRQLCVDCLSFLQRPFSHFPGYSQRPSISFETISTLVPSSSFG